MGTFFKEKMNMAMTSCKATYSQAAFFGRVFGIIVSTILVVLILLIAESVLLVTICSIAIITCALMQKGKPKMTMKSVY